MKKIVTGALGALAMVGTMLVGFASPASAHHNEVLTHVSEEPGECGAFTIDTSWKLDEHTVDNAALVVRINDEVTTYDIGETAEVGPFEVDEQLVEWRIWGGGERDYDDPALTDLDALVKYLDGDGTPLDADAPGVAWHEVTVNGCVPSTEVTPEAPTTTDPVCNDDYEIESGTITVPDVEGLSYQLDGEDVEPGTSEAAPGDVTWTVTADEGHEIPEDVETEGTVTIAEEPDCTEPEPDPEPGAVTVTVTSEICEKVEVHFEHTDGDEPVALEARVDGESIGTKELAPGETTTLTQGFDAGSGEHTVEYRVDDGEWQTITVDCGEAPPAANDCDAYEGSDAWCEPDVEDYDCDEIDDEYKPVTVTDVDNDPFRLDADDDGKGCEVTEGTEDGQDDEDEELPDTGTGENIALMGGLGLLVLGGGALLMTLRRRAQTATE